MLALYGEVPFYASYLAKHDREFMIEMRLSATAKVRCIAAKSCRRRGKSC